MKDIKNLRQLLIHQLQHLHIVETQLLLLFPRMAKLASNTELCQLIEKYGQKSKERMKRVKASLKQLDQEPVDEVNHAMAGLITEAGHLLERTDGNGVQDAVLATIAHSLQQFEISGYTSAKAQAQTLGYKQMVNSIQKTMDEGTETGRTLLKLASKQLHAKAMAGV